MTQPETETSLSITNEANIYQYCSKDGTIQKGDKIADY